MDMNRRELLQRLTVSMAGLTSAGTLAGLLASCEQDKRLPSQTAKQNADKPDSLYFGPHQRQTISRLASLILPRTNTPGALDAGVPEYIESVVRDVFVQVDQTKFNDGLFSFDLLCSKLHESNFIDLARETQSKLAYNINIANTKGKNLKSVLRDTSKLEIKTINSALDFFAIVKELSIFGFFTSEIGATQVLHYNAIPGRFDGCASLSSIGKTWATPR